MAADSLPDGDGNGGTIDCATACVEGCQRPEDCPSREARDRAQALLDDRSLDELVALATRTVEARTRARIEREAGGAD